MASTNVENGAPQAALRLTERIQTANNANLRVVKKQKKADTTYERNWKKFTTFIDKERENGNVPPGDKYLTRENVDLYFSETICDYIVTPDTARRVVSALQWHANFREYGKGVFDVDSPAVKQALEAQKVNYGATLAKKIRDPHEKLPTDVMTDEEYMRAFDAILKRNEWEDLLLAWAICDQTYLRYGSYRVLTFDDICLDLAHGPKNDTGPGNKAMLSLILRPGGLHKDRFKYTKVVGNWRHREYIRCSTGALAMSLMTRFRNDPNLVGIDFYADANGYAKWWDVPLRTNWNDTNKAAEAAFKSVYSETGIEWSKCLHLRKGGMDKAGTEGVGEEAVSTMSKHNVGKIRRYMPELHKEVMKVMAGFETDEEYYVPRILLEMPWNGMEMTSAVFPHYMQWVEQQMSPFGDKTKACENFLYKLLPFLAIVALQDGIYWIRDYPNNSASMILRNNTFPNYERWAANARQAVTMQQAQLQESRISQMDAATQASYHVLRQEFHQAMADSNKTSLEEHEKTRGMIGQVEHLRQERDFYRQQYEKALQQHQGQHSQQEQQRHVPIAPSRTVVVPTNGPRFVPTHRRPIQAPLVSVEDALRSSERVPNVPPTLGTSVFTLLVQHEQFKLASFELANKKHWDSKLRLRYSKRKYFYDEIRKRASRFQGPTEKERMRGAALAMDVEKGNKSMAKYYELLKSKDPNTKKRAKRTHDEI